MAAYDWETIKRTKIFPGESGGDYNALYGFSNRPGGKYENVRLTEMPLSEVLAFTDPSGEYGQGVKADIGRVATPTGAYQVVGTTLRAAVKALGLDPNTKYDEETQDRIGQWIYENQGPGAWEGWGKGGGGGDSSYAWTGPSGGGSTTMSTSGGPAMTPYTERQSIIKQLLGGEGMKGKLGPMFNPLEGANPRLEQERFDRRAQRFDAINARNAAQMMNTDGPVHWTQTLSGIGSAVGGNVMQGASERAGSALDSQMQELMASGQMTPEVLARITALDPQYGQTLTREMQAFQRQRQLQEEDRAFTLQRDEAQRQHEALLASLKPTDRTALEQNLIAAGYDPNGPIGEDGLNDFQRAVREQLTKEGGGGDAMTITFDENNRPIISQGAAAIGGGPGVSGGVGGGVAGGVAPPNATGMGGAAGGLTFGELGKVGEGMARGVDETGALREAPIPGSVEDVERQAAAEAERNAEKKVIRSGKDVLDAISQVEEMIDWTSTGFVGKLTRDMGIGGAPGTDIEIALRPVVANLGFDRLQEMRAASTTGAALGQVTERENTLLQSTIKSLDPNGSGQLLRDNLEYVKNIYDVIVNTDPNNPEEVARYEQVMGFPLEARGAGVANPATGTPAPAAAPVASPAAPAAPAGNVNKPVVIDGMEYIPGQVYEDDQGRYTVDANGNIVDIP